MRILAPVVALLGCVLLSSDPVLAAAAEFSRGQAIETVDSNTITVDNNVKYVTYTAGEVITVTLDYSSTCNVVFSGLTLRTPQPFTPPKAVTGAIANVTGTSGAGTTGTVTFDIHFDKLKKAGKSKSSGMAHLDVVFGVDTDCNPATGDANGVDEAVTIGVQISVSTATHP
jgi:hypothetical protein